MESVGILDKFKRVVLVSGQELIGDFELQQVINARGDQQPLFLVGQVTMASGVHVGGLGKDEPDVAIPLSSVAFMRP